MDITGSLLLEEVSFLPEIHPEDVKVMMVGIDAVLKVSEGKVRDGIAS